MSAYVIATLAATGVAGLLLLHRFIGQKQKRKHMNQILNRFSDLVARHGLYISSQAILQTCIIALDGINRKMIVQHSDGSHCIIDLDEVLSCSVIKQYGSIYGGDLKTRQLDQYLQKVLLCFHFKTGKPPVEIPFYQHNADPIVLATERENKAKDWEAVLSKMLWRPVRKIA